MKNWTSFFGGAGIGLLIGFLIGMTTSGMVGAIVGSVTTILLAFINTKEETTQAVKAVRIGAFGLFCVGGILAGLYLRVTNAFLPSPTAQVKAWMKDSIFSKEEAKNLYLYDRFAFIPQGQAIDTTKDRKSGSTVLYSTERLESDCEQLEAYDGFSLENKLSAYASLSTVWALEIEKIQSTTAVANEREQLLNKLRKAICNE